MEVSQALVPDPTGYGTAYIASGETFPDALAAGPATQSFGGQGVPLLLVPRDGAVPPVVADELRRLDLSYLYVVGGPNAVSDVVLGQLRGFADTTTRISGATRYGTAAQLGELAAGVGGTFFVATGENYPDALAGAAVAARTRAGLLLTRPSDLPEETASALQYFDPQRIVVLGGPDVVSDAVLARMREISGVEPQRLFGDDRYATAARAVEYGYPAATPRALVATGTNFPDALAGGPLSAALGAPLLLVDPRCAPTSITGQTDRLRTARVTALGGSDVVSDAAAQLTPCR